MTSYEIDRLLEVENPQRIFIRGERQAILKEDMAASDKVRIQYASKYAQSSNYWKNSIGKSRGIRRLDVKGRKQEQEAAFTAWAAKNTLPTEGYSNALNLIRESVEETAPYFASSQYLSEAIGRSVEILALARLAVSKTGGELTEALKAFYKDYNMPTDRRVAKRMFRIVGENCKELPSVFAEVIDKQFGGDTDAYVDYLYDNSVFADERKALAAAEAGTDVSNDPAVLLNKSYTAKMRELAAAQLAGKRKFADGQRLYIAGLMRMRPNKAWASDANFTLRLTYGRVLPYDPADGIHYNYYTTLKGVMEKEKPAESHGVHRSRQAQGVVCGEGFRTLRQRTGRASRGIPRRLRHHGRQLRFPGAECQRGAVGTGVRRQLGSHVGRCGVRTRVAADDCRGRALRAVRHRQIRRSRMAARRIAVRIKAGFSGGIKKACPAGAPLFFEPFTKYALFVPDSLKN